MIAPTTTAAAEGGTLGRPARPGGTAYWARIEAVVHGVSLLTDEQCAVIKIAARGTTGTVGVPA